MTDPQRHPPEVRTGDLIGYSCDACQDLHRQVVVFRPIGDEVRLCAGCMRAGLGLLGYVTILAIPTDPEDEAIIDKLTRRQLARRLLETEAIAPEPESP